MGAAEDDLDKFGAADIPNGVVETCEILKRNADVGDGRKFMAISGAEGSFLLMLPEAPDWKMQCYGSRFFGRSRGAGDFRRA
jgi:hypothetical protein